MINDMEFELYLVRHGQSETNVNPDMMGQSPDVPLTKLGKRQAELLGERFATENKEFDYVFSSPYKRAFDTAILSTGDLRAEHVSIIRDPRLREYSAGDWTGVSRKETINVQHMLKMGALNHNFLPPNGESLSMVERRASEWLEDRILYNDDMQRVSAEKKAEGKVLSIIAFSHGMTIKTLLHHVMGFDKNFTWKVSISNTSITQLYFGKNGWGLGSINDFGHLLGENFDIYSPEVKNGS